MRGGMAGRTVSYLMCSLLAALALSATGCGYTLSGIPKTESVSLGRILNNTHEPKLQDWMCEALTLELMKNGIHVSRSAGYTVSGSINRVSIKSVAERDGLTIQYEVNIGGEFHLTGPDGRRSPLRSRGLFLVTFSSVGDLESVIARKQQALKTALDDMAGEIATSVFYAR
jgi:hypothetical protein